jgi:hypothetical protein
MNDLHLNYSEDFMNTLHTQRLISEWHNPKTMKARRVEIEFQLRSAGYIVKRSVIKGFNRMWVESEAKTS